MTVLAAIASAFDSGAPYLPGPGAGADSAGLAGAAALMVGFAGAGGLA